MDQNCLISRSPSYPRSLRHRADPTGAQRLPRFVRAFATERHEALSAGGANGGSPSLSSHDSGNRRSLASIVLIRACMLACAPSGMPDVTRSSRDLLATQSCIWTAVPVCKARVRGTKPVDPISSKCASPSPSSALRPRKHNTNGITLATTAGYHQAPYRRAHVA